jgi:flagellar biosynthesis/type III secretory pathway protein FliH
MRLAPLYQQEREQAVREGLEQGLQLGRQEEGLALVLRQLHRRCGEIPVNLTEQVYQLSIEQLENLGEALLDFESQADLVNWINTIHLLNDD